MNDDQRRGGGARRGGGRPRRGGDDGRGSGRGQAQGRSQPQRGRGDGRRGRTQGGGGGAGQAAPPPRRSSNRPPKPRLPDGPPRLRRDVRADLRATAPPAVAEDVARAVSGAAEALEAGDTDRALELLRWAKAVAPRSGAVREGLGIAAYHAGDFQQAHRELLAYRRLTDRHDQNHLLADSARALGRPDKVSEYVRQMAAAEVPPDRLVEAYIVQSAAWADRGDLRGALGVLERLDLDPDEVRPWHPRVWYAAAELFERMGDRDRARDYFEAITAVTDDFLDVDERLAALNG